MTSEDVVKEVQEAVGKTVPFADVNGEQGLQQIACNQIRQVVCSVLDENKSLGRVKKIKLESWTTELKGKVRTVWGGMVVIKTYWTAMPIIKIPFTTKALYEA